MNKYLIMGLFASSLQGCFGSESSQNTETPPNVIFIYADDLGRGILSHYGQKFISTPNIDRIANEGISFGNVRGCMFSAPARASLLSGYHDCHGDKWVLPWLQRKGGNFAIFTHMIYFNFTIFLMTIKKKEI